MPKVDLDKNRVRQLITKHNLDLVYLCETICTIEQAKVCFKFSKFSSFCDFDVQGRKGGSLLMWIDKCDIKIVDISPYWIHVEYVTSNLQRALITFVYGPPKLHNRHILWEFIQQVHFIQPFRGCSPVTSTKSFMQMINLAAIMILEEQSSFNMSYRNATSFILCRRVIGSLGQIAGLVMMSSGSASTEL